MKIKRRSKIKLCNNCIHYLDGLCTHPKATLIDVITGNPDYRTCKGMRFGIFAPWRGGRLFEQQEM